MRRTDLPVTRKRKSYHHGDLRRALVKAAVALLTKTQHWDFSLREVARCAGVSHNAPYSHFADKRELLGAVAANGFEILRARTLTAVRGKTKPADALKALSIAYLRFGTGNPAQYRLMLGPTLHAQGEGLPAEVVDAFAAAQAVCREVLKRGSDDGTFRIPPNDAAALELALIGIWSVVHGLILLYVNGLATLDTAKTIESLGDEVVAMFMHGIVGREKENLDAGAKPE